MECQALWKVLYNFIWFWPISCVNTIFEREPPPPISAPWGAYSGVVLQILEMF